MTIAYSDFADKILRVLNDPDGDTHEDELIFDGVLGAHRAILPWVKKTGTNTFTATSGSGGYLFELPSDMYEIEAVELVNQNRKIVGRALLSPGSARRSSSVDNDWIVYPHGYLSLSETIPVGQEVKIYYSAYWTPPVNALDASFVIEVPDGAHMGMIYYAAAHTLTRQAGRTSNIRQFLSNPDRGTPVQNPLLDMCKWFLERFAHEMKLQPPYRAISS